VRDRKSHNLPSVPAQLYSRMGAFLWWVQWCAT